MCTQVSAEETGANLGHRAPGSKQLAKDPRGPWKAEWGTRRVFMDPPF